jgi:hypothetical protein
MRLTRGGEISPGDLILNYGQYFRAIADVVSDDGYVSLMEATAMQLGGEASLSDMEQILIYAEKHGSDYHPAKIEVIMRRAIATFVMNVAVTERGKERLSREYEVLQKLNKKYDFHYLPSVYFQGKGLRPSMPMFLAEWFAGYHEFHLSIDRENGSQKMALWDTHGGRVYLSESLVREIYRQAAMILTLYYDVDTFEQIFPWHHSAGDFAAKVGEESTGVRLITARQYASMFDASDEISAYEALSFFLLNLSLRMRLDRLDGVGAVAWADDPCVHATLEGFMKGLRIKEQRGEIPTGFLDTFIRDITAFSAQDLLYGIQSLVDACDQSAPDIPVIRNHIEKHTSEFYLGLQVLGGL